MRIKQNKLVLYCILKDKIIYIFLCTTYCIIIIIIIIIKLIILIYTLTIFLYYLKNNK